MGYDPFSPLALVSINVLCMPAGKTDLKSFSYFVDFIQREASIVERSASITNSANNGSANVKDETILLFNFSKHVDIQLLQRYQYFEPNRQPALVLVLIDGSSFASEDDGRATVALYAEQTRTQLIQQLGQTTLAEPSFLLSVFNPAYEFSYENTLFLQLLEESAVQELRTQLVASALAASDNSLSSLRSQEVELPQSTKLSDRPTTQESQSVSKERDVQRQSLYLPSLGRTSIQTPTITEDAPQALSLGRTISAALLKLQAGLWSEALDQFADGARAARDGNSPAWHAKALEGILTCLILFAWAGQSFQIPQNCYPTTRGLSSSSAVHSIADDNRAISEKFGGSSANRLQALTALLPGLLATILNLYDKSTMGFDNALPSMLVCEARVRFGKLLLVLRNHDSKITESTLEQLVGPRTALASYNAPTAPDASLVLKISALSNLFVESIFQAQTQLTVHAAVPIYLAVCQCLSVLKLERKHGFFLKDILQKLPPVLVESRSVGTQEANSQLSTVGTFPTSLVDLHHQQSVQGIRALLRLTTSSYGLPDPFDMANHDAEVDSEAMIRSRLILWLSIYQSGDIATKLEVLRLCVRVCDALTDLQGSVYFMSLLLFMARQTITLKQSSSSLVPLIGSEEQQKLTTGIHNAVENVRRTLKGQVFAPYWDDFLIRSIRMPEHSSLGKLVPHSSQDLSHTTTSGTAKKNPFIYNPFAEGPAGSGPEVLVKDEVAIFEVLLQNPLEVQIEVESLSLLAEGCTFEASEHSVAVGPLSIQIFTLTGKPTQTGDLKIKGCKARVRDCYERQFFIYSGLWKPRPETKRRDITNPLIDLPARSELELKVVDRLPKLHIASSSLVQDSLMLLDGERSTFSLTLNNPGDLPADLVLFSYQDSVARQVQEALTAKDAQPADTYEMQYQLTSRPAIKRVAIPHQQKSAQLSPAVKVGSRSEQTFDFEILAKPGLTEAIILIDYTYIGKPRNEVEGTFYTRQLSFRVNVTVNASIDIHRCQVLSLPSSNRDLSSESQLDASAEQGSSKKHSSEEQGNCLLQLDLRSIWPSPITFTVETCSNPDSSNSDGWGTATTGTLQPASIDRALFLIPRIFIADPFAPIPSLDTKRQFVVSASRLTLEAEMASREAFWYREELCRRLRITWKEVNGKRSGDVDVRRAIRLGARMIDALRVEHVQISFDLVPSRSEDFSALSRLRSSHFQIKRDVFAKVIVKVHNLTNEDLKLLLRLQPGLRNQPHNVAMDLNRKLLWSGVLQRVLRGGIKAGETVEAELGIIALAASEYEINATVEEIRSRQRKLDGAVDLGVNTERRIWHAGHPCLITVVD